MKGPEPMDDVYRHSSSLVTRLMHPRDQITMVMQRIYGHGMTTTSGGNLSILDDDGRMWITPAGTDKGTLEPEQVVCVGPDGPGRAGGVSLPAGRHTDMCRSPYNPSSEYPFHRAIYEQRADIRAIVHAHPPALVSFSVLGQLPDTRVVPKAKEICGEVGFAEYGLPGSAELGEKIARVFGKGHDTVLLENHGVVTVGTNLFEAFERFETLDFCARLLLKASILGEPRVLAPEQQAQAEHKRHVLPEYEPAGHSSRERELRKRMCRMIGRAYDQHLITSTEGTFSCRLDQQSFVITPYGMDRKHIDVADLIVIRDGKREKGRLPSRSARLHERLYGEHAGIGAIIIAHPTNIMAFGVSGVRFDSRLIPESYVVLRDIPVLPYGPQFDDLARLSSVISEQSPVVMVENDCVITTGSDLLEAYDRLEVIEYSAKAVIAARPVGDLAGITPEQIAELEDAFGLS